MDMIHQLPRLKWACRRGMLELDVLLGNFLENHYPELTDDDKRLFIMLLEYTDPEIFSWLMGKAIPTDQQLARITEIIRKHAKS
ncbi:MAG TPA: succinate dehydrogenase assembly factor 2 [Gammaproteobacteria bacterium]|nr:succinate dehydrogenase assembly factor 2 [Gammaproteobacteria bacterium]